MLWNASCQHTWILVISITAYTVPNDSLRHDIGLFFLTKIGTNGVIGLGETFNSGSIHAMDSKHVKKRQILCPFWTDLASKDDVGKVYYNTYRRYTLNYYCPINKTIN